MCHLVLLLPVVGLPLLWLLPPAEGIVAYALLVLVSTWVYLVAIRAQRRPPLIGMSTLLHAHGTVRRVKNRDVLIWIANELWSGESPGEVLAVGDSVEVVALKGLQLVVRKVGTPKGAVARS
jgi:membrane protein implicated in regulation of membrane protease activity